MRRLFATRPTPPWMRVRPAVARLGAAGAALIAVLMLAASMLDAYADMREREAARIGAQLRQPTA